MLGPVVGGHSLQIVIYDTEMNKLNQPKIGLDGVTVSPSKIMRVLL
jgi:hypothetical protein